MVLGMQRTARAAQPTRLAICSSRIRSGIVVVPRFYFRRHWGTPGPICRAANIHGADEAAHTSTKAEPVVKPEAVGQAGSSNESNGTSQPQQAAAGVQDAAVQQGRSGSPTWEGSSTGDEEADWVGQKPFSWRDIDWGLASLVGGILLLSFGAYRVLNYFSVYQHSRRPKGAQITTVVQRPSSSTAAASSSPTATPVFPPAAAVAKETAAPSSSSSKSKPSRSSRRSKQSKQQADAAASEAGAAAPEAVAAAGAAAAAGLSAAHSFDLPAPAGVPGAPQPSPLDAGFSSMPGPWACGELGRLDLAPLAPLPDPSAAALQQPELPSIQVELPAKAVTKAELAALPTDPSLPSMRERAHIAMRASGAAMEASQRAAAYSAAASSAASRAAEAAEQAATAAAAVQAALERAADETMAEAVKRMNRAVEMVADAESRAAAAAAAATAYQDISDGQAAAAAAAADLPAMPARTGPVGHIANLQQVLHEQMFSVRTVIGDFFAGVWGAVVGAVAAVQAVLGAAVGKVAGLVGGNGGGVGAQPAAGSGS